MYSGATFGSCQFSRIRGRGCPPKRCVVQPVASRHLQIVFVTTEVAPWSKMGGLGDVMAALPAALAARGHRVMTVSPMYSNYADVRDTGVRVPVRLPDDVLKPQQEELQAGVLQHQPQQHQLEQFTQCTEGPHQWQALQQQQPQSLQQQDGEQQYDNAGSGAAALRNAARVNACGGPIGSEITACAASVRQRGGQPTSDDSKHNWEYARYYMCCSAGVHRVFVDHPLYQSEHHRAAGKPWSALISTYTHPAVAAAVQTSPDLAAAASVLCQAALAAPLLLWGVSRGLDGRDQQQQQLLQCWQQQLGQWRRWQEAQSRQQQAEMQLLMDLLGLDSDSEVLMAAPDRSSAGGAAALLAAAAGEQQAKLTLHLQHPQQLVAGLATPVLLGTAGSAVDSRWQISDLLLPCRHQRSSSSYLASTAADGPLLYIANDWPCGVLPAWLDAYKQEAQRCTQNPHMHWLQQQQQQEQQQEQQQDVSDKAQQHQPQPDSGADVQRLAKGPLAACSSTDNAITAANDSDLEGGSSTQAPDGELGDYAAVHVTGNDLSNLGVQSQQLMQESLQGWQLQHHSTQLQPNSKQSQHVSEQLQQAAAFSDRAAGDTVTTARSSPGSSSSWSAAADAWLQEMGYDPGSVFDADLCALVSAAARAGRVPPERIPEVTQLQSQLQLALEQEQVLGDAITKLRHTAAGQGQQRRQLLTTGSQPAAYNPVKAKQRSQSVAPAVASVASHKQELSLLHQILGRQLADSKVVFAVHNYAYQGIFQGRQSFDRLGLSQSMLSGFVAPVTKAANILSRAANKAAAAAAAAVDSQLAALAEALQRLLPGPGAGDPGCNSRDAGMLSSLQSALLQAKADKLLHQAETTDGGGQHQPGYVGPVLNSPMPSQPPGSGDVDLMQLNWLHAGVSGSDVTITVSPGYAHEMLAGSWAATGTLSDTSMTALLASKRLQGILNGLDTHCWDPARDPLLPARVRYTLESVETGKAAAKQLLQRRLGLKLDSAAPLFAFVGRLTPQKGVDVILAAVPQLMKSKAATTLAELKQQQKQQYQGDLVAAALGTTQSAAGAITATAEGLCQQQVQEDQHHAGVRVSSAVAGGLGPQLVMLGTGERRMEEVLDQLAHKYPGQAVGVPSFNDPLAHLIMAAADVLLVPSRFEPCGLVALAGLRYGAVPVATCTGGLADIVTPDVGYLVPSPGPEGDTAGYRKCVTALAGAMHELALAYGTQAFAAKRAAAMSVDVSWDAPCQAWEQVLLELVSTNAAASGDGDSSGAVSGTASEAVVHSR